MATTVTTTPRPGQTQKVPAPKPKAPAQPANRTSIKTNPQGRLTASNTKFTNVNDIATMQQGENKAAQVGSELGQNANVTTDFGQSTTTIDPRTGQATVNQGATGLNAQLLGQGQRLGSFGQNLAMNQLSGFQGMQPYNTANIGSQYAIPTANEADRQRNEDAVYSNLTRDLSTNYNQDVAAKKQELADRGVPMGSQLYTQEMDRLDKGYQRQQQDARSQAIQQSGQEMSNQFQMGLQAHQQALGDYTQNYNMPLSLAQSLQGMGYGYQNPNLPQYQGAAQTAVNYGDLGNLAIGAQQKGLDRTSAQQISAAQNAAQITQAQIAAKARVAAAQAGQNNPNDPGFGGTVYTQ
jgi:hypothetical protein